MVFIRWHVRFNPLTEKISKRHLWVTLRGFPYQLWTKDILTKVGNMLGKFIFLEESIIHSRDKRAAHILVEFDMEMGLPEVIDLQWKGRTIEQEVDYLFIPF